LRQDIIEVLGKAKECGYRFFRVSSNGSLLTRDTASALASIGVELLLSVDGPKEANDSIRGEGAFDKVLRAMELMAQYSTNVQSYTVITKTLTQLTPKQIEELIGAVSKAGGSCVNFGKLTIERLPRLASLLPSKQQLMRFALTLLENKSEWEEKFKIKICMDEGILFPLYWSAFCEGQALPEKYAKLLMHGSVECSTLGCPAGREQLIIDPEGNLLDCVFNRKKFGNPKLEPFERVLARLISEYSYPRYARCLSCKYQVVCGGSCRLLEMHRLLLNESLGTGTTCIDQNAVANYIYYLTSCTYD
jgi:radical SAM protein with 4Fe4S-binding SPASM domain